MAQGADKRACPLSAIGCVRSLLEVLSPFQFDGCQGRDFDNRTRRADGACKSRSLPNGAGLPRANWWSESRGGAGMKAAAKQAEERRAELLIEIGCEEIPAGMLPRAEEDLRSGIEKLLTAENLADGVTVESFSAPRRLTAW